MPSKPNRLSQFWQELKRRKVNKVIAMYAGAAYVLFELAGNVVEPLNLPDWTPRLVILVALIGFPIVIILSWLFDITPEGIGKTASVEEVQEQELELPPVKRKLKASDVIIGKRAILIGIMAYPRIFGATNLKAMTMPVTIVNEFGEKEIRRVYKEDYITRLCVFPFLNETGDTLNDWLQFGIPIAVKEDLLQFSYLYLDSELNTTHFQEQIRFAKSNNHTHFITGVVNIKDGTYEITSKLHQVANGAIVEERNFEGRDFLSLIDSISYKARIDLGISEVILNSTPDISISGILTENLEAYRLLIKGGIDHRKYDLSRSFFNAHQAIKLDSTFAYALLGRAADNHNYSLSITSAIRDINQAKRHSYKLSEYREIDTRRFYYMILEESEKAVALTEMQADLKPYDINLLLDLIDIYQRNFLIDKLEKATYRLNELIPDHPPYQILLARSYLYTGKLNKGLGVLEKMLRDNPENTEALMQLGEFYLHKNDLDVAERVVKKAILLSPEDEKYWSSILNHIAYVRNDPESNDFLEPFSGYYRFEEGEIDITFSIHRSSLLSKSMNQYAFLRYPVSDSQLIAFNGFHTQTFKRNDQGQFIKLIHEQRNHPDEFFICWKEDSLIFQAKNLLNNGKNPEALHAFREAYNQNPEYYYLNNYIQHLEFVLSLEYETSNSDFFYYAGEYGDLLLYKDGNLFYKIDKRGLIYQLLPMAKDKFMIPSIYNTQIHIIQEGEEVTGLKYVLRDGSETFHPRTSMKVLAR